MPPMNLLNPEYKTWLKELKSKIRSIQIKAAVAVVGLIGQQPVAQLVQQLVTQIPWGHNILIFSKSNKLKNLE